MAMAIVAIPVAPFLSGFMNINENGKHLLMCYSYSTATSHVKHPFVRTVPCDKFQAWKRRLLTVSIYLRNRRYEADAYMFYRCFFLFFPSVTKILDNRSRERLNGFS